jgi:hypothetical protein
VLKLVFYTATIFTTEVVYYIERVYPGRRVFLKQEERERGL